MPVSGHPPYVTNEGIPDFLRLAPPLPPWTFTMLSTYRNICGHQAYRRYIKKDQPYVETEAMAKGNEAHAAMERRLKTKVPLSLPEHMRQWESLASTLDKYKVLAETQLAVTSDWHSCGYHARNCYGRGRADAVVIEGDRAYIADHKTGRAREDPFELEVQAALLHAKYPRLKVIKGQYWWLRECRPGDLYDLSDTEKTRKEIEALMGLIETDLKSGTFEKRKGKLCGWCSVKDCENWFDGGH